METTDTDSPVTRHGILVGWNSQDLGSKIVLKMETFGPQHRSGRRDPDNTFVHMTKSQAATLANYLFKIAGTQPPPARKKGLMRLLPD